jgi:uncharacterized membrane protein YecN with MAPEG domain
MPARGLLILDLGGGLAWGLLLLVVGAQVVEIPVFALMPTIMTGFLAPGLVLLALVGRVALRRAGGAEAAFAPGGPGEADNRVLANTVEQLVLALTIWPAAAVILGAAGPGVLMTLGLGFAVARIIFWIGAHRGAPLRVLGFAMTFHPTVLVALWTLWELAARLV